jgi:hypothetical protein
MNAFDRMRADRETERAAEYERRMADYFRHASPRQSPGIMTTA